MQGTQQSFTAFSIPKRYDSLREAAEKEYTLFRDCWKETKDRLLSLPQIKTLASFEQEETVGNLILRCRTLIAENQTQLAAQYEVFIIRLSELLQNKEVAKDEFIQKMMAWADNAHATIWAHALGVKIIGNFFFSLDDYKRAGYLSLESILMFRKPIDCTQFAFYHLNDQFLTLAFLEERKDNNLADLGYKNVTKPRAGDLVMYHQGRLQKHYGILKENGRVISKWGYSKVMEHELGAVPLSYGDNTLILRKRFRFQVSQEVIEQIDAAKKSLDSSCRHPLCAAPMSLEMTKQVFLKFLKKCFREHEEKAFVNSFFGTRTLKPLLYNISAKVHAIQVKDATKESLLKEFRSIVKKESYNLPLDFTL